MLINLRDRSVFMDKDGMVLEDPSLLCLLKSALGNESLE